jgi:hypothetical protein
VVTGDCCNTNAIIARGSTAHWIMDNLPLLIAEFLCIVLADLHGRFFNI